MDRTNYDVPAFLRRSNQGSAGAIPLGPTPQSIAANRGEIDALSERLQDELGLLADAVGMLEAKLTNVLTPALPGVYKEEIPPSPGSEIGRRLQMSVDTVTQLRIMLSDITGRVAL